MRRNFHRNSRVVAQQLEQFVQFGYRFVAQGCLVKIIIQMEQKTAARSAFYKTLIAGLYRFPIAVQLAVAYLLAVAKTAAQC